MYGCFCTGLIDFMFAVETLIEYVSLFLPNDSKKMTVQFFVGLKMSEVINIYLNLSNQIKFRLNETDKIKDYFNTKIQEKRIISKKLSKYHAAFDYFVKILYLQ